MVGFRVPINTCDFYKVMLHLNLSERRITGITAISTIPIPIASLVEFQGRKLGK
jgi:hypothetical protein